MEAVILVILTMAFSLTLVNIAYAEAITSEQTTISENIQNNPVAQDILDKIEKSKRWIAQIEQRNFESSERQKELEEKRSQVLQNLEEDLKKWEELWGYYTFDKMLERALENNPANSTSTIYDHPLKFTASKINAGRDALQKVLLEGGGPEQARDAFAEAAKITREEMVSANSIFNVLQNNAYYNQQILFNADGTFDDSLSGDKLRQYYKDYRTNPSYLQENPFDKIAWEDLGKNTPDTKCRSEYVLVYRTHADDYICTTAHTAEMWVRHQIGTPVNYDSIKTNNVVDVVKLQQDRIVEKVNNLNSKIKSIQKHYEEKLSDTNVEYDLLFVNMNKEKNDEEKQITTQFNNSDSMSHKVFSQQLSDIREKYAQLEENVIDQKSRVIELLTNQHYANVNNFAKNYESDSEITMKWNSDNHPVFEVRPSPLIFTS